MNTLPNLTDGELATILNALPAYAEDCDNDARMNAGNKRLATAFRQCAADARALANRLQEETTDA